MGSWDEKLRTGYIDIDQQHENICQMVDALNVAMSKEDVQRYIEALELHFATHFDEEQALMELHDYPLAGEHAQLHARFLHHVFLPLVRDLERCQFDKERLAAFVVTMQTFVHEHVLGEDMKIVAYINNLRSTEPA